MDSYFNYYLLSYFSTKTITTVPQIIHIFHGKRTPSMFYLVEIRQKHHGFSQFRKIKQENIKNQVNQFIIRNHIVKKEKGYTLTKLGKEQLTNFFATHYYPKNIKNFSNVNLRTSFWNRYQLYTQVFSEYSYNNSKYIPIIKNPSHQENIRQLFYFFKDQKEQILVKWKQENEFIFSKLEQDTATFLANLLTGHELVGYTREQMATTFDLNKGEQLFFLLDGIEELIEKIKKYKNDLPLLYEILQQTNQESFYSLSPSTFQTYQMLNKGETIKQIAQNRKIKENTVKEHILEITFIVKEFQYRNFIPGSIYQQLIKLFKNKEITFKEAKQEINNLEFMHFRLVELERLRAK